MSQPQLVALLPSEDLLQTVVNADRRFTLHRLVFDLYAAAFPARVPQLVTTVIFCGGAGEYAGELRLSSPSGAVLSATPFSFEAKTYHLQAVNLAGVELPEPGEYSLTVTLEDRPLMTAPLKAVKLGP